MHPKFVEGEVVLLQSVEQPECNGEYTVHAVRLPLTRYKCRVSGVVRTRIDPSIGYILDGPIVIDGNEVAWNESALRKKHQPGDMSFDDLMSSLSSPKLLKHEPSGSVPL